MMVRKTTPAAAATAPVAAGRTMVAELDNDWCGPQLSAQALERGQAEQLARLLKAVADPTRLQLLSLILAGDDGEACVCDLTDALGLTQPTVSHHLKVLVDAGLLSRERRGTWAWYALLPDGLSGLRALLG
jgi:ArsR family transcriptional regulator